MHQPKKLKKLLSHYKNSQRYDEIPCKILKISSPPISTSLNNICNKWHSSGMFFTRIKYTEIKSLYRKGNNVFNNRPSKSYWIWNCKLNYYTQITKLKYDKYLKKVLYILITLSLAEPFARNVYRVCQCIIEWMMLGS